MKLTTRQTASLRAQGDRGGRICDGGGDRPLAGTVEVEGEERDATWKEGVGIYVEGFEIGKGNTVLIEGTLHEIMEMRRMQMEGGFTTLIVKARKPWQ